MTLYDYRCESPKVNHEQRVGEAEPDYCPFLEILRQHLGWRTEDYHRGRTERITTCLWALSSQGDLATNRAEVTAPLLAHVLSVEFGDERDDRLRHASPEESQGLMHPLLTLEDLLLG